MEELMNDVDMVFKMISKIPVSGDAVDLMAASREKLRHVYSTLKNIDANKNNVEGGDSNG